MPLPRPLLLLLTLLCAALTSPAQSQPDLFVIPPQFYLAGEFSEGLAPVSQDGKWGFIDKYGNWIILPQFDWASSFSDGITIVYQNDKYGFIDKTGYWIILPQFDWTNSFSEGLAPVKQNDKSGFIDKKGNWIIQPQFDYADSFSEGLVLTQHNGKHGFIDKYGNWIIQPQFDWAYSFSEGLATVEQNGKWGFIDKYGNWIILPQFDWAGAFSEGLAPVIHNGKYGFIDKYGNWIIQPQFDWAYSFSEGLASVEQNGKWGFIDKYGNWIILPQFDWAGPSSEGLAPVEQNGKWGFIRIPNFGEYLALQGIDAETLRKSAEEELEQWKQKGEFESTAEWHARVNDANTRAEAQRIAQRLGKEYDEVAAAYCSILADGFAGQVTELSAYDADNEVFTVGTEKYGDVVLRVPRSQARDFKEHWPEIKKRAKAELTVVDNEPVIKSATFGDFTYTADAQPAMTYVTEELLPQDVAPAEAAAVAADDFEVVTFAVMPDDLTAATYPRGDTNGNICAVVKVQVKDEIVSAKGMVVGDVVDQGYEKWVYMAHDAKQLELHFRNHAPLRIHFEDLKYPSLTRKMTYVMRLREKP